MKGEIRIEDVEEGMKSSFVHRITNEEVLDFAKVTGDYNPIHVDDDFAKKSRFGRRVVHGMLTASFFSRIFGTQFPGNGCIYIAQELSFKKPVYIDDEVTASVIVTSIDLTRRRVYFSTVCEVRNVVVTTGSAEIYMPKEE